MTRKSKNKGVIKYDEIVQRELLKEAIFKDISYNNSHGVSGYAVTLSKIDRAGLSGTELNNAKNIMNWGILQEKGSACLFAFGLTARKKSSAKRNSCLGWCLQCLRPRQVPRTGCGHTMISIR